MMFFYTFLCLLQEKINSLPSLPPKDSYPKKDKKKSSMSLDSTNPIVLTVGTNSNIDAFGQDDYSLVLPFLLVGSWFLFFKILMRANLPLLGIIVLSEALLFLTSSYLILFIPILDSYTLVHVLYLLNIMAVEVVVAITILIRIASLRLSLDYSNIAALSSSSAELLTEFFLLISSGIEYFLDLFTSPNRIIYGGRLQLTLYHWGLKKLGFLSDIFFIKHEWTNKTITNPILSLCDSRDIYINTRHRNFFLNKVYSRINFLEDAQSHRHTGRPWLQYRLFMTSKEYVNDVYSYKNPHESMRVLRLFEQKLHSPPGRRIINESELLEPYGFSKLSTTPLSEGINSLDSILGEHEILNPKATQIAMPFIDISSLLGSTAKSSDWHDKVFNTGSHAFNLLSNSTGNKKNLEPKGWSVGNIGQVDKIILPYRDFAETELLLLGDSDLPWRSSSRRKKKKYKLNRLPDVKKKFYKHKIKKNTSQRAIKYLNKSRKVVRHNEPIGKWNTEITDMYRKVNRIETLPHNILNSYFAVKKSVPYRINEKNYNIGEVLRPFSLLDISSPNSLSVEPHNKSTTPPKAIRGEYFDSPLKKNSDPYLVFKNFWENKFSSKSARKLRRKRKNLRYWKGWSSERNSFRQEIPNYYWLTYLRRKKNKRFFRRRKWKGWWDREMQSIGLRDKNWGSPEYHIYDRRLTDYWEFRYDEDDRIWTEDDVDDAVAEFYGQLYANNGMLDDLFDTDNSINERKDYEDRQPEVWWSGLYPEFKLDDDLRPVAVSKKEVRTLYSTATRKFRKRMKKKSKSLYGFSWKRHRRRLYFIKGSDMARNKKMIPKLYKSGANETTFKQQVDFLKKNLLSKRNIPIRNYVDSLTGFYPDLMSARVVVPTSISDSGEFLWNTSALVRDWLEESISDLAYTYVRFRINKPTLIESIFTFGFLRTLSDLIFDFLLWTADIYIMFCEFAVSLWSTLFEFSKIFKTAYWLIPYSSVVAQESASQAALSDMGLYYRNFFKFSYELIFFFDTIFIEYVSLSNSNTISVLLKDSITWVVGLERFSYFHNLGIITNWIVAVWSYPGCGVLHDLINLSKFHFKLSPINTFNCVLSAIQDIEIPNFSLYDGYEYIDPIDAALIFENSRSSILSENFDGRPGRFADMTDKNYNYHPDENWMLGGESRIDYLNYYYAEAPEAFFPTIDEFENKAVRKSRKIIQRKRMKKNLTDGFPKIRFLSDTMVTERASDSLILNYMRFNIPNSRCRKIFKESVRSDDLDTIRLLKPLFKLSFLGDDEVSVNLMSRGASNIIELIKHNHNKRPKRAYMEKLPYTQANKSLIDIRNKLRYKLPPRVWNSLNNSIDDQIKILQTPPNTELPFDTLPVPKKISSIGSANQVSYIDSLNPTGDLIAPNKNNRIVPNFSRLITNYGATTPLLLSNPLENTFSSVFIKKNSYFKLLYDRFGFTRDRDSRNVWSLTPSNVYVNNRKKITGSKVLNAANFVIKIIFNPTTPNNRYWSEQLLSGSLMAYWPSGIYYKPFESRLWGETPAFAEYRDRGSMPWDDDPDSDSDVYDYSIAPITTRGVSETELSQIPNSFMVHEYLHWLRDKDPREESISNISFYNYTEEEEDEPSLVIDPDMLGDFGTKHDPRYANEDLEHVPIINFAQEQFSDNRISAFDISHFTNNNKVFEKFYSDESKRVYASSISDKIWKLRGGKLGLLPARQRTKEHTKFGSGTITNFVSSEVISDNAVKIHASNSRLAEHPRSKKSSIRTAPFISNNVSNHTKFGIGDRYDTRSVSGNSRKIRVPFIHSLSSTKDTSVLESSNVTWDGKSYSVPVSTDIGDEQSINPVKYHSHYSELSQNSIVILKNRSTDKFLKQKPLKNNLSTDLNKIVRVGKSKLGPSTDFKLAIAKERSLKKSDYAVAALKSSDQRKVRRSTMSPLGREPLKYIYSKLSSEKKDLDSSDTIEKIKMNTVKYRGDYVPNERPTEDYTFEDMIPLVELDFYENNYLAKILGTPAMGAYEKITEPSSGRKRLKQEQLVQFPYRKKKFLTNNELVYRFNNFGILGGREVSKSSSYGPINNSIFSLYEYDHDEFDDQTHERFVNWNWNRTPHPHQPRITINNRTEQSLGRLRRRNIKPIVNRWELGLANRDNYFIKPYDEYLGVDYDEETFDEMEVDLLEKQHDLAIKTNEDTSVPHLIGPVYIGDDDDLDEIDDFIFEPPEMSGWVNKMREFKREIIMPNSLVVPLGSKKYDNPFKDSTYGLQTLTYNRRALREVGHRTSAIEPFIKYYRNPISFEDSIFTQSNEREALSYLYHKGHYPYTYRTNTLKIFKELANHPDVTYDSWRKTLSLPKNSHTGKALKLSKPKTLAEMRYFGIYRPFLYDRYESNLVNRFTNYGSEFILVNMQTPHYKKNIVKPSSKGKHSGKYLISKLYESKFDNLFSMPTTLKAYKTLPLRNSNIPELSSRSRLGCTTIEDKNLRYSDNSCMSHQSEVNLTHIDISTVTNAGISFWKTLNDNPQIRSNTAINVYKISSRHMLSNAIELRSDKIIQTYWTMPNVPHLSIPYGWCCRFTNLTWLYNTTISCIEIFYGYYSINKLKLISVLACYDETIANMVSFSQNITFEIMKFVISSHVPISLVNYFKGIYSNITWEILIYDFLKMPELLYFFIGGALNSLILPDLSLLWDVSFFSWSSLNGESTETTPLMELNLKNFASSNVNNRELITYLPRWACSTVIFDRYGVMWYLKPMPLYKLIWWAKF